MAEMYNPAHPGEIVREECLKSLGLTVTAAADALGVTRKVMSDLLNGHAGFRLKWRSAWRRCSAHGGYLARDADAA